MPPHQGLTSTLLETLQESRSKLQKYVEMKKMEVDAEVASYNELLQQEQVELDEAKGCLQSVQTERSSEEGMVQRRRQLDQEQAGIKEHIQKLEKKQEQQKLTLEGMYYLMVCGTTVMAQ